MKAKELREMTNEELGARLLSINSGVSSSEILYSSKLDEQKLKRILHENFANETGN